MNNAQRLILFAHARTGSTTLMRLLDLHPTMRMCHEPFHPSHSEWYPGAQNHLSLIADMPSLDRQTAKIFATYNGLKALSYQLPENLYEHLLLRDDTVVIFLRRRNLLQAAVSGFVARQTNVWQKADLKKRCDAALTELVALPIDELRRTVEYMRELDAHYGIVLSKKPAGTVLQISYEDLFAKGPALSFDTLKSVFSFLRLELPEGSAVSELMDPGRNKVTSANQYHLLPNWQEIDRELGSDETGWLLSQDS